jgi:hypothetical protein
MQPKDFLGCGKGHVAELSDDKVMALGELDGHSAGEVLVVKILGEGVEAIDKEDTLGKDETLDNEDEHGDDAAGMYSSNGKQLQS